jgi:drug/metabolite transporter (DMT)-like permease
MPRRALIRQNGVKQFLTGFSGGVLSSLSYALAVFAQTLAPLALVAAIRETSVILAALIGVIWFKERPVLMRICAACVVAFGVILIALS